MRVSFLADRLKNFKIIGLPSTVLHDDAVSDPQLYNNARIDVTINSTEQFSSITIVIPAHTGWPDNGKYYLTLCEVEIYSENNDCSVPGSGDPLVTTVRQGTGYTNAAKGLVSTWTVLEFSCNDLYRLEGSQAVTCLPGGVYNATVPNCTEIRCTKPSNVINGNYVQPEKESYAVGDTLTWTCDYCYESHQNLPRQCQVSSEWSGDQPICTRITCTPGQVSNGTLQVGVNKEYTSGEIECGNVVNVLCAEGFKANVPNINCTEDGEWDVLPLCMRVQCKKLERLVGGYYTYMSNDVIDNNDREFYEYGMTATAVCNEPLFKKSNDSDVKRTCDQDGNWTGNDDLCVALCKTPSVTNGYIQGREDIEYYESGHSVTLVCLDGFELKNQTQATIICQENHTWDVSTPSCTAVRDADAAQHSSNGPAIGGGVTAAVVILALVVIAVFVIRKRRVKSHRSEMGACEEVPQQPGYSNAAMDEKDNSENSWAVEVSDQVEPYYNITNIHKIPQSVIKIEKLAEVVMAPESATGKFRNEFQVFPEGMKKQHHHALQNKDRNRYRGLYAYDDTRVVLDIWNEETDTDYINACYVQGFYKPNAYIASQGPVKEILNDFWRMVWQNNCGKIVMLTNLMEDGKMKCKQYWPESGSETYGSVVVTLESTDTFANFTIRTLTVRNADERRRVLQFHFTSWPDKDVPYFCSSLVHFRSKVNAAKTSRKGPLVVHCSAGIGRTGTFIAIDYLVDQAEKEGYVDVAGCVQALRRQRVNMVQTQKQYIFVHLALVEILVLKTSVVPTAKFEERYQELLSAEGAKRKRKMDLEFEILWHMTLVEESQISEATEQGLKTKNRHQNILPFKEFMPSLSQPGRYLFGEYINAAFLPLYKEDNALIITQTPLETTIEDFWKMVLHQGVHTIVMMNHVTELSTRETYWPTRNDNQTHGEHMSIFNKKLVKQSGHTICTLTLTTETEEREVKLIQFEKWSKGKALPEDPHQMLSALTLMEENQRKTGNKPAIVHCMDGVEKSGLFCVVAALLDRMKVEQDVAISQVIQEMRNRRQNIIPNVEQFQFCHEVVLAFMRQFETYSNFAYTR